QYWRPARCSIYRSSSSFFTPLIDPLSATPISNLPPWVLAKATNVFAIFSQLLILFLKSSCWPSPCHINVLMCTCHAPRSRFRTETTKVARNFNMLAPEIKCSMPKQNLSTDKNVWMVVIVAALGYFVDIYDLVIFSIVRVQSFRDIGIPESDMRTDGEYVLNMQMAGLLLGGLLWGVLADRFGRIKVLFGSILMYSLANIANGFVNDIHSYAFIRLIAGIGLAGELGAGITLVSESMQKSKRGYGTMVVASVGVLGAVAAYYVSELFSWRNAYFAGGAMGLLLLVLRVGTFESAMFKGVAHKQVARGSLRMLFADSARFKRYMYCLLIGLPIWF